MTLTEAIREALTIRAPDASQERVQETIARRLEDLAPEARMRRTGYFNHTWAPDLVVASGDQVERWVYLRFGVGDASFEDDLRYLSGERPFFLDLATTDGEPSSPDASGFQVDVALAAEGREEVLVSDLHALDEFEGGVEAHRELRAATQRVVVGGRGHVNEPAAETIVGSYRSVTESISEANAESLRSALNDVESYLTRVAALDLETDLRAKWIAAGHAAEAFPGEEDWRLSDRAPWEIAQLVLSLTDNPEGVDAALWDEIAQAISASDLGHELWNIGQYRQGGAVDTMVRAGLPYWTAEYAYVPPLEADALDAFHWAFGSYALELHLLRRRAFFTDRGRKWTRVPRAPDLPRVRSHVERLTQPGVMGVGIVTPEENISHELRPSATVSLGSRLQPYLDQEQDAAWRAARLSWLELRVPGTAAVAHIDFARSVVHTTNPVPLRTYALLVAEFVAALSEEEMVRLRALLDGDSGV